MRRAWGCRHVESHDLADHVEIVPSQHCAHTLPAGAASLTAQHRPHQGLQSAGVHLGNTAPHGLD